MAKGTPRPGWMRDLDQEQIDFYLGLEPEQAMCRGKRRHDFKGIIPGQKVPEFIIMARIQEGITLTEHCHRGCGRWVRYTTDSRGLIDYTSAVYGGGGPNYLATGLDLTAADDREFLRYEQAQTVLDSMRLREKQRLQPASGE